jgi:hypothetical protein
MAAPASNTDQSNDEDAEPAHQESQSVCIYGWVL